MAHQLQGHNHQEEHTRVTRHLGNVVWAAGWMQQPLINAEDVNVLLSGAPC
jgi:hypothetical protein